MAYGIDTDTGEDRRSELCTPLQVSQGEVITADGSLADMLLKTKILFSRNKENKCDYICKNKLCCIKSISILEIVGTVLQTELRHFHFWLITLDTFCSIYAISSSIVITSGLYLMKNYCINFPSVDRAFETNSTVSLIAKIWHLVIYLFAIGRLKHYWFLKEGTNKIKKNRMKNHAPYIIFGFFLAFSHFLRVLSLLSLV